jgi:hypothetical protein
MGFREMLTSIPQEYPGAQPMGGECEGCPSVIPIWRGEADEGDRLKDGQPSVPASYWQH